jgi:iron complex outermembrane receptor protein
MRIKKSAVMLALAVAASAQANENTTLEEVTVIADKLFHDTSLISPSSTISAEELEAISLLTSEDAVAYEPSLVIRRRFVGDPNGTMGIRGSGMFQTARSLVFADGLPLHYLLQTRWSGAPRWSLVGANEIETAQVIYGPYSAEYSGNAMGGVVNINTRTPSERRVTIEGSLMAQDYDELGTDERYDGSKLYLSYEDRFDALGVFASYSRLDNDSQPMTNYYVAADERADLEAAGISGFIPGKNDRGDDVLYIGDSGSERALTELYKLKLTYNTDNLQLRGVVAYEDRKRELQALNNYLQDSSGATDWSTGSRNYQEREQSRESLLLGLGISGNILNNWYYDVYATNFEILEDAEVRSGRNPADPSYESQNASFRGRLTEHGDTGWKTLDIKLGTDSLFSNEQMRLSLGYHIDHYQLEINPYNYNAIDNTIGSARAGSGGETSTQALFAQWGLAVGDQWDFAVGLRYEDWESSDGYLGDEQYADRSLDGFSPKFSIAYAFSDELSLRYSVARAMRFPITEELFSNENRTTHIVVSDPSLQAEVGIHHNLSLEQQLDNGFVRVNLFADNVDDTIYNQNGTILDGSNSINVTTFLAVDEVETRGIEFVYQQKEILQTPLSIRFNVSYTDAEITKNAVNPDIVGNTMPRVPEWRANMMLSYTLSETLSAHSSLRYASDSFGDLDNGDTTDTVYGAIDAYLFVNAKLNWQMNEHFKLSLGADNIFNELAYVAHPWPSRTFYLEGKYHF